MFTGTLYKRLIPRDIETRHMSRLFASLDGSPTETVLQDARWNQYSVEQPARPVYIYLVSNDSAEKIRGDQRIHSMPNVFIWPSSDMRDICQRLEDGKYDAVRFTVSDFPTLPHFSVVTIIAQVIVALSDTLEHVDMSFLHDTAEIDDPTELVRALVKAPNVKTFVMTWTICEHQLELNEVLNRLAQKRGIQLGLEYEQSGGCTCPGKCVVSERFEDI